MLLGEDGAGGQAPVENQPITADSFNDEQLISSDGFNQDGFPDLPESGNTDGQQGGQQAQQEPVVPEGPKFKTLDGRELSAEDFEKEYRQLGSEFTRRSQELSRLQKIEENINKQPDYSGLSKEERDAREVLDGITRDAVEKAKSEINPLIEEIKVKAEINDLQKKFEDFDPESVIPFAIDNRILDLETAYKIMNYEAHIEKAKEQARLETTTHFTRRGPGAGIPAPGNPGAQPKTGLQRYDRTKDEGKSARELLDEGLAELGK